MKKVRFGRTVFRSAVGKLQCSGCLFMDAEGTVSFLSRFP